LKPPLLSAAGAAAAVALMTHQKRAITTHVAFFVACMSAEFASAVSVLVKVKLSFSWISQPAFL